MPPCASTINAFGQYELEATADPPNWFRDETSPKSWKLSPYTIATWPYEEMYKMTSEIEGCDSQNVLELLEEKFGV